MFSLTQPLRKWPAALKIVVSFAAAITVGALLLALPISQLPSSQATFLDHLFTAVSMVCVTGLSTLPLAETYSYFGQIIGILLIQTGGLGLMTLVATFLLRMGKRVRFSDTVALKEALNRDQLSDFRSYILSIFRYTLVLEGIGMIFFSFRFVPELGLLRGLFTALFLSVSAFCNAGFDTFGATSLQGFVHDPLVNSVVAALLILGGIGFSVWFDVTHNFSSFTNIEKLRRVGFRRVYRQLKPHSRLAINTSLLLILIGASLFLLAEWNNPESIGPFSVGEKVMTALFQTITMRTAGFSTIDYALVRPFTLVVFMATMFIGGSPGGTAGGLKTTTFALIALLVYNEIKGQEHINYSFRTIPFATIRRALVVFVVFLAFLIAGVSLLSLVEEQDFLLLLFETVSALGTVGVSVNLTAQLSRIGQAIIMVLMFVGRIGPITIFLSLSRRSHKEKDVAYARTNILIG